MNEAADSTHLRGERSRDPIGGQRIGAGDARNNQSRVNILHSVQLSSFQQTRSTLLFETSP